jgi:gamma-glutamylcyclotransferase (GGCT)/AIG2-like uncharacterized protein YtfP
VTVFQLFTCGTLLDGGAAEHLLAGCTPIGRATVRGILYDIDAQYPAILLYGAAPVHGVVWQCPTDRLLQIDDHPAVRAGLFRRVAQRVTMADGPEVPCWLYVAGPALSRRLIAENIIPHGRYVDVSQRAQPASSLPQPG